MIEVLAYEGVEGDNFLQAVHLSEAQYSSFPASKWQVRVFRSVIHPATRLLSIGVSYLFHRGSVESEFVCHDYLRRAEAFH